MTRAGGWFAVLAVAAFVANGCGNAGEDRVLSIDALGAVEGVVFLDFDGSGDLNEGDRPLEGVRVGLSPVGSGDTAFVALSDAAGEFALQAIPVGSYEFVVDTNTVGDTVDVVGIDMPAVTLGPDEVAPVTVVVSFPSVSIAAARAEIPGRRLFVEGIATTSLGIFGDTSLHVVDTSSAIRALRVQRTTILAGDSVRLLGNVGSRNGQPVLESVTVTLLSITTAVPPAEDVSTATARTADAGRLDAALVRVQSATIVDTATVGLDFVVTVNDGSGPVDVVLDGDLMLDTASYVPTAVIDGTGVLVPLGPTTWRLKPRSELDVVVR